VQQQLRVAAAADAERWEIDSSIDPSIISRRRMTKQLRVFFLS
jgi:hypothetical protein